MGGHSQVAKACQVFLHNLKASAVVSIEFSNRNHYLGSFSLRHCRFHKMPPVWSNALRQGQKHSHMGVLLPLGAAHSASLSQPVLSFVESSNWIADNHVRQIVARILPLANMKAMALQVIAGVTERSERSDLRDVRDEHSLPNVIGKATEECVQPRLAFRLIRPS
jgi:hypothetical protein